MDLVKDFNDWKQSMTPMKTMKFIAGTIVSCGAMAAVVSALKGSTAGAKGLTKLMMKLGIFVLGCKAGDMAEKYFNETMDDLLKAVNEAKEEMNNESDPDKQ